MFDLVSLFKLFLGCLDFFLENIVLLFKSVIFLVQVFFLLLNSAFLTGKLASAVLDFLFKLIAALVNFVLSLYKGDFLLSASSLAVSMIFSASFSAEPIAASACDLRYLIPDLKQIKPEIAAAIRAIAT